MTRNVVVTGMGVVSPIGADLGAYWDGLSSGQNGIVNREYTLGDDLSITLPTAPIDGLDERLNNLGRELSRADRFSQLAVLAADEAIANAGLEIDDETGARMACIIGTGIGGQATFDNGYEQMLRRGKRPHPLSILKIITNAPASHMSIRYGARGPAFAISSACATGAHSIGVCADIIRHGGADVALAGASEAVLTFGALTTWKAMHILASETCRPFSKNRNGLIIGEGAGVLVLEEEERARKRGANIVARLAGFGMNADGKDMINPEVAGAAGAIRLALEDVAINDPSAVYINAHGTGTLLNDPTETKAVREVFGDGAEALIMSSTKSMHGHLLGAAGGIEVVASILALNNNVAPPTMNYDEPDPACDLNYAPNEAIERKFDLAISNSFAFGGLNAVVAFEKV
jgi:nodulation protein E